ACAFGMVESNVGLAGEFRPFLPMRGCESHANAHAGEDLLAFDLKGPAHRFDDPLAQYFHLLRLPQLRHDHDELVAAYASNRVALAREPLEPFRQFLDHQVARGMAERVVDLLETVEVEEEQGRHFSRPLELTERGVEPFVE